MRAKQVPIARIHNWSEVSYQPLVFSAGCQIALPNAATTDTSWTIVEHCDTHPHDTEIRQMTKNEQEQLSAHLPVRCG